MPRAVASPAERTEPQCSEQIPPPAASRALLRGVQRPRQRHSTDSSTHGTASLPDTGSAAHAEKLLAVCNVRGSALHSFPNHNTTKPFGFPKCHCVYPETGSDKVIIPSCHLSYSNLFKENCFYYVCQPVSYEMFLVSSSQGEKSLQPMMFISWSIPGSCGRETRKTAREEAAQFPWI